VTNFRRSGTVVLLIALAAPVWGVALRPSSLTIGRGLILLAAAMLALDWRSARRPLPLLPRAVWLLIAGITALCVWTAVNAATWGCGTCGGDVYSLSELAVLCVLVAVLCGLEPALRSAVVLAVLAGGALEALLALGGVHGLTPGTVDTSAVQGRLAGTFGNPNELGLALAFSVPAGLGALRIQPPRWRLLIIAALVLVVVALVLTLSRAGMLAAAAGGAVVVVLAQPARSWRRRGAMAGLVAAAVAIGIGYPLFTTLREHAESRPIDPTLRARDTSGWDGTRLGMVATGGSGLVNPASGGLEIQTSRPGQGVSRAIGTAAAKGHYELSFQVRAVRGSHRLGYGLEDGIRLNGPVAKHAVVSERWRRLRVQWRPNGNSPYARFYVWSPAASPGFVLRNVVLAARPGGAAAATRSELDTRLGGSVYAQIAAQQHQMQQRDISSRLFAVRASLSAFATQPVRGIGWGRFVDYSSAHGGYGHLPTHDEYLRFLAELGAIGALLLVLLGVVVVWAARDGPRDELGLTIVAMLATGGLALVFINGLVSPDVMMPLAFAAAVAGGRAGTRAPAVTREAAPWWPAYFGPRPQPGRWLPDLRTHTARPSPPDWRRVLRMLRQVAPPLPPPVLERRRASPVREPPSVHLPLEALTEPMPAPAKLRPAPRLPEQLGPTPRPPTGVRKPADSASAPSGYRPALDGLRAVAVLAVIGYHATAKVSGGFLGVDVFFVLSGYLITSILMREELTLGRIRLTEFWARRVRRLLPAVLLLVLVCALQISRYEDVGTWALRRADLLSTLFYFANWHFIATDQSYFATFLGASPVRHTWTLAIEEQFYVVWPLLVIAAYRLGRGARRLSGARLLAAGIVAGTVASTIAMALLYDPSNPSRSYFGTDTRASSLLAGGGLGLLVQYRPGWLRSSRGLALAKWAWAPVALAMLGAFLLASDQGAAYYDGGALAFALLVVLALFVVEAAPTVPLAAALSIAPMRWIGQISYGLYLWHWPVIVWMGGSLPTHGHLRKLLELAVMFAAAAASYYVVERPIRSGRLPGLGLSRRRLAVAMPLLIAAVAAATVHLTTLGSAKVTAQLAPQTPLTCPQQTQIGAYAWCPRRIGKPGAPVVASVGDSTSQALYPGMRLVAQRRGWTYIEAAEGGCSILPLLFVEADTSQYVAKARQCVADIPRIIADVQARYRPDVWVLTDRWSIATMVTRQGKPLAPTDPRRNQPIETVLRSLLRRLTADGARVLFVPTPPPGEPVDCALHKLASDICDSSAYSVRDPATVELTNTVHAAAAGLHRVTVVPINNVVCPGSGQCPAMLNGTVVRYDSIHYSEAYSRKLVPVILKRAQRSGLTFAPHSH
jgi:peptidoglycan/LPS O-acetylase OafA/YrhL/O-antigen ligase